MSVASQKLWFNQVRWSTVTLAVVRPSEALTMNAIREYLYFRLDTFLNTKSSFMPSQRLSKTNHFIHMLHFLRKRFSSEGRKHQPKPAMEHSPLHCLRGGDAHHLLLSFFVLWTPKPDYSSSGTSEYSFFFKHIMKIMATWHKGASEGNFLMKSISVFPDTKPFSLRCCLFP